MEELSRASAAEVRLVSVIPGRIRLRAGSRPVPEAVLSDVGRTLERIPGVREVSMRIRSASIVVEFEPRDTAGVIDGLRELGVELAEDRGQGRGRRPAEVIGAAAGAADRAVAARTGGTDLKLLVPLGLGLLSLRQMARGRDRLGDAPWYLLAWYSAETFFRFHGGSPVGRPDGSDGEEA